MRLGIVNYILRLVLLSALCAGLISPWPSYAREPQIIVFREPYYAVDALFISSDGRKLMSGGNGAIAVWDLTTGKLSKTIDFIKNLRMNHYNSPPEAQVFETYVNTVFHPDGEFVALGYFTLFDLMTRNPIRIKQTDVLREGRTEWGWSYIEVPDPYGKPFPRQEEICTDGKYYLDGAFDYMDLNAGFAKGSGWYALPGPASFSPDGLYVLHSNSYSHKTKSYRPTLREMIFEEGEYIGAESRSFDFEEGHLGPIECSSFSPNGRYVITGSRDYTLKLWDVKTQKQVRTFEGHSMDVTVVTFSPDGRYVISGSDDNSLRLWDIDLAQEIKVFQPKKSYEDSFTAAAFSKNGRYLLSSSNAAEITFWEVSTGREIVTVKAGKNVKVIAFSPDDRYAITGHENGYIKLWDIETTQLVATMIGFDDGEWLVITPEGYFNASPNAAKNLKIRIGGNTYSIDNFYERFYNPALVAQRLTGRKSVISHDIRQGVATPPTVRIINPASGGSYDKEVVEIVVEAQNTGGGIDEVRLYHNECTVGEFGRGVILKKPGQDKVEKRYNLTLIPGDNTFRAVGFSKERTESKHHEIVVRYTGPAKETELYLVVIGINEYKNSTMQLNFATADAAALKAFFEQKWKGLFNKFHITEIYDNDATKEKIKKILSKLKAREQDVVLLYLAGHGQNIGDEWYFLCCDVIQPERDDHLKEKGISSTELSQMVKEIRALKKTIFIDACKSGGMLLALSRGVEDRRAIAQLARSTGTHVIAASTDQQIASEVIQLGHGLFTYTVLQGLGGDAENKDKMVTVRGLITYIEGALPEISVKHGQEPQYPIIDSRGQDFPLVMH